MWKVILCVFVFAVVSGCAPSAEISDGDTVTLVLPAGDPIEGRRSFQAMGCTLCHTATGEEHLPTPSSLEAGPELGREQAELSRAELMRRILDPAHRQPLTDDVEAHASSSMVDYCETLTIRQLVDITAYLRYVGE